MSKYPSASISSPPTRDTVAAAATEKLRSVRGTDFLAAQTEGDLLQIHQQNFYNISVYHTVRAHTGHRLVEHC